MDVEHSFADADCGGEGYTMFEAMPIQRSGRVGNAPAPAPRQWRSGTVTGPLRLVSQFALYEGVTFSATYDGGDVNFGVAAKGLYDIAAHESSYKHHTAYLRLQHGAVFSGLGASRLDSVDSSNTAASARRGSLRATAAAQMLRRPSKADTAEADQVLSAFLNEDDIDLESAPGTARGVPRVPPDLESAPGTARGPSLVKRKSSSSSSTKEGRSSHAFTGSNEPKVKDVLSLRVLDGFLEVMISSKADRWTKVNSQAFDLSYDTPLVVFIALANKQAKLSNPSWNPEAKQAWEAQVRGKQRQEEELESLCSMSRLPPLMQLGALAQINRLSRHPRVATAAAATASSASATAGADGAGAGAATNAGAAGAGAAAATNAPSAAPSDAVQTRQPASLNLGLHRPDEGTEMSFLLGNLKVPGLIQTTPLLSTCPRMKPFGKQDAGAEPSGVSMEVSVPYSTASFAAADFISGVRSDIGASLMMKDSSRVQVRSMSEGNWTGSSTTNVVIQICPDDGLREWLEWYVLDRGTVWQVFDEKGITTITLLVKYLALGVAGGAAANIKLLLDMMREGTEMHVLKCLKKRVLGVAQGLELVALKVAAPSTVSQGWRGFITVSLVKVGSSDEDKDAFKKEHTLALFPRGTVEISITLPDDFDFCQSASDRTFRLAESQDKAIHLCHRTLSSGDMASLWRQRSVGKKQFFLSAINKPADAEISRVACLPFAIQVAEITTSQRDVSTKSGAGNAEPSELLVKDEEEDKAQAFRDVCALRTWSLAKTFLRECTENRVLECYNEEDLCLLDGIVHDVVPTWKQDAKMARLRQVNRRKTAHIQLGMALLCTISTSMLYGNSKSNSAINAFAFSILIISCGGGWTLLLRGGVDFADDDECSFHQKMGVKKANYSCKICCSSARPLLLKSTTEKWSVLLQGILLAGSCFVAIVPWSTSCFVPHFCVEVLAGVAPVELPYNAFEIWFFCAVSIVWANVLLYLLFVLCAGLKSCPVLTRLLRKANLGFADFLCGTIYLLVLSALVAPWSCSPALHAIGNSTFANSTTTNSTFIVSLTATMASSQQVVCYTPTWWLMVTASAITVPIFIAWSLVVSLVIRASYEQTMDTDYKDAYRGYQFRWTFLILDLVMKSFVSFAIAFSDAADTSAKYYVLCIQLVASGILLAANMKMRPCTLESISFLQWYTFVFALITGGCGVFVSMLVDYSSDPSMMAKGTTTAIEVTVVLYIILTVTLTAVGVVRYRGKGKAEAEAERRRHDQMATRSQDPMVI